MCVLSNVEESVGVSPETAQAGECEWLAEGDIPKAAVTLLSGEPGSGKSFVACTLAATVSQVPDARVLYAHTDPAERLHARLGRAGADADRVELVGVGGQRSEVRGDEGATGRQGDRARGDDGARARQGEGATGIEESQEYQDARIVRPQPPTPSPQSPAPSPRSQATSHQPPATHYQRFGVQLSRDTKGFDRRLDTLIAWLSGAASARRVDLIVVDDLESWCGKALSAAELAEAAARLDELARTTGAAVLAVVRSATTTEGRVTARSLDRLLRAADVVWMVAVDRDSAGHRWLVPLKNNLAALPGGKTFQVADGRVEWLTQPVPDDALTPGSRRSLERVDRQTAGAWLVEALREHDLPSRMLYAHARQCGFSRNTILRAAHRMGMHSHKSAFDGGWKYSLRDALPEAVAAFRPQPIGFGIQDSEKGSGFRVQGSAMDPGTGRMLDSESREGFRIQDSAFSGGFAVGDRVQGTGDSKGVGGQRSKVREDSGATEDEGVRGRQGERAKGVEKPENCSKSPKTEEVGGQGSGAREEIGIPHFGNAVGRRRVPRCPRTAHRKSVSPAPSPQSQVPSTKPPARAPSPHSPAPSPIHSVSQKP